jgi:hypothetical protein
MKDGADVKLYRDFDACSTFIIQYSQPNVVSFESLSTRRFLSMDTHSSD